MCVQHDVGKWKSEFSEDCLFLNIHTSTLNSSARLPVMVFIPGGALTIGGLGEITEAAAITQFTSNGVIVVNVQYRLGVLGFFTTDTAEFPGLRGFWDQHEALKWVQREIAHFGGDPARVTLVGHSAGAASVNAHSFSKQSEGLFHQVILMSGTLATLWKGQLGESNPDRRAARDLCHLSHEQWKSRNYSKLVECMKSLPASVFANYTGDISHKHVHPYGFWVVHNDGDFLSARPSETILERPRLPTLIGMTTGEIHVTGFHLMKKANMTLENFNATRLIPEFKHPAALQYLYNVYLGKDAFRKATFEDWMIGYEEITNGALFWAPAIREAQYQRANGNAKNTWVYEFSYQSAVTEDRVFQGFKHNPVPHYADLRFLFLQVDFWNAEPTEEDKLMAHRLAKLWTDFIKTGTMPKDFPALGSTTTDSVPYYEINTQAISHAQEDFHHQDSQVWNEVYSLFRISFDFQPSGVRRLLVHDFPLDF